MASKSLVSTSFCDQNHTSRSYKNYWCVENIPSACMQLALFVKVMHVMCCSPDLGLFIDSEAEITSHARLRL